LGEGSCHATGAGLSHIRKHEPKAKGGAETGVGRRGKNAGPSGPRIKTLADYGIGKHLADRIRKVGAMSDAEFEKLVADGRKDIYRSVERLTPSRSAGGLTRVGENVRRT
jgi:hypothetical protein